MDGTPQVFVGGILGIVSTLTAEQSQAIYQSISRGYRLDVELIHPELIHDIGLKKVFSENYVQAFMGIREHCIPTTGAYAKRKFLSATSHRISTPILALDDNTLAQNVDPRRETVWGRKPR
ncbi:hypothetical protein V6R98_14510 [Agrobacterium sp. CCNWLW71]|uniref:hypothetical protein n=1 Tax=unclassified Agrobacterium TaxID=2632611 RepID=UPI002FF2DECD